MPTGLVVKKIISNVREQIELDYLKEDIHALMSDFHQFLQILLCFLQSQFGIFLLRDVL